MTYKKDIALKHLLTAADMKEISAEAKSMVKAPFSGKMAQYTRAPGHTIICMAMECTNGVMVASLKANGNKTICMVGVNSSGRMEDSMMVNIIMIKCKAMVSTLGLTANNMKANG